MKDSRKSSTLEQQYKLEKTDKTDNGLLAQSTGHLKVNKQSTIFKPEKLKQLTSKNEFPLHQYFTDPHNGLSRNYEKNQIMSPLTEEMKEKDPIRYSITTNNQSLAYKSKSDMFTEIERAKNMSNNFDSSAKPENTMISKQFIYFGETKVETPAGFRSDFTKTTLPTDYHFSEKAQNTQLSALANTNPINYDPKKVDETVRKILKKRANQSNNNSFDESTVKNDHNLSPHKPVINIFSNRKEPDLNLQKAFMNHKAQDETSNKRMTRNSEGHEYGLSGQVRIQQTSSKLPADPKPKPIEEPSFNTGQKTKERFLNIFSRISKDEGHSEDHHKWKNDDKSHLQEESLGMENKTSRSKKANPENSLKASRTIFTVSYEFEKVTSETNAGETPIPSAEQRNSVVQIDKNLEHSFDSESEFDFNKYKFEDEPNRSVFSPLPKEKKASHADRANLKDSPNIFRKYYNESLAALVDN